MKQIYLSIIKQCTNNADEELGSTRSADGDVLRRAVRLMCYCLTVFPPSDEFAGHLAYWIRQEPIKSLGNGRSFLLSTVI